MITVEIAGGLGNQMFMYAAGRALSLKHNTRLILDTHPLNNPRDFTPRDYGLQHFGIDAYKVEYVPWVLKFLARKYREVGFHYDPNFENLPDNVYIRGYWQSEKYFKEYERIICNDFTLKNYPRFYDGLDAGRETVSVHIRRGDYVTNPAAFKVHGVLPLEYYYSAIDRMRKKLNDPIFKIFTEDIRWAKENLEISYPHLFIKPGADYLDMMLMAACRNHIIANSSFSWWAAWLCRNPEKKVIAPKRWFVDESKDTKDLIPEGWVRM